MNRIEAIASFIDRKDKVVDVGCDQAKLGILLANKGISSIACDVSEKVISKAKLSIGNLAKYIDLRVSDGLSNINEGESDTLVLAGMGTHTIVDIVSNTNLKFKKIITISNNYHDILRNKMNELNYKISKELIIKENDKYYNLIVFIPGNNLLNDSELYLGVNHQDNNLLKEYLELLLNKYNLIVESSSGRNEKIKLIVKLINDKLNSL